jgi:hypothetical protein
MLVSSEGEQECMYVRLMFINKQFYYIYNYFKKTEN